MAQSLREMLFGKGRGANAVEEEKARGAADAKRNIEDEAKRRAEEDEWHKRTKRGKVSGIPDIRPGSAASEELYRK